MFYLKYLQFTLILLLSVTSISQSNEIKGIIMDTDSLYLEGATVILTNKNLEKKKYTITDSFGAFNITADEDMLYLKVTFMGYETKTIMIPDTTKKIRIILNKSIERLGAIKLDYKPAPVVVK